MKLRSLFVITLWSVACTTWSRPEPFTPATIHADRDVLEVFRGDHSTIDMSHAHIEGDSLIGLTLDSQRERVAIPLSSIQKISRRTISPGRSVALGAGILLASFGALVIIALAQISNTNYN